MTQSSGKEPSNNKDDQVKQQLITKLKEMFQLDQPELDFGLYKIMHAKADQISHFIESDLAEHIDTVFGEASTQDSDAQLQKAKQDVMAALGETAFDSEGNLNEQFKQLPAAKPYLDALQASKSDGGTLSNSASIYDHLYRFFSRYYDSGDFLSRRHHVAENSKRAAPYAVPYDGREVYLHWANKDQYYIKTSESFNSYTFNLAEAIAKEKSASELSFGHTDKNKKVHFQLVDADEGEHNNVKAKENQARFFIIHAEQPVKLNTFDNNNELILQFEYRADPNKKGQNNTWQQNKLKEAEALIFATLDSQAIYKDWSASLKTIAPTEKEKSRTLLAKYLKQYTARNTMDYFIHKDLGGFLSRELDFYIKNEIMHLDDIEQADADTVESWLLKVRVLRLVAKKVISFLAQLEDFQKKLWLKKKFVTETNYCMTLDRVPVEFYAEILANQKQLDEWVELGFTTTDTKVTKESLKENPFLVIDTGLFDTSFKERLLAEINDLDETTDGVLIHSENAQALSLIGNHYRGNVTNIFVDPPYNTGDDGFVYKDSYSSSTWLAMMDQRLDSGIELLQEDGAFFVSIGDEEQVNLASLIKSKFGKERFFATLIWEKKKKGTFLSGNIAKMKDYILCVSKNNNKFMGLVGEIAKETTTYPCVNASNGREIRTISAGINSKYKESNYFLPSGSKISAGNMDLILHSDLKIENKILVSDLVIEGNWRYTQEKMSAYATKKEIYITQDLYLRRIVSEPRYKNMKDLLPRIGSDSEGDFRKYDLDNLNRYGWGTNEDANDELHQILGEQYAVSYPKPSKLITLLLASTRHAVGYWLDYFSGSGTTAHAIINLNRRDGGKRKYILVEMGEYFDTVLKPRIKKVVYSESWKDGKPVADKNGAFNGISHCFKYNRLESYEDTINNLSLNNQVDPQKLSDEYILNYLLETETAESPSLLNIEKFKDPTHYRLTVKKSGSDEKVEQAIDLVETFNWLIGLRVEELDKWRSYDVEFAREQDPELPDDQHTRLLVKKRKEKDAYSGEAGKYQLRLVEGWCCRTAGDTSNTDKVLVVWRKLTDDAEKDAAILEAVLTKKGVNQADSEYDLIYINGSHGLQLSGGSKSRLMSLEETFMAKMWEDAV